jgi:ABC-type multidrug transport system ATPase subunit
LHSAPQAADIISKVMCGNSLPSLKSELQLLKAAKGLGKPQVSESELLSIPSQFCREGYKQIMLMEGGPMRWSFLKPLMKGKILFAPDNRQTRQIITKMNRTAEILSHFKQTLDAWTQTTTSVQNFYKASEVNARLQAIQALIDFLNLHFDGLLKNMDANNIMKKMDQSGGLLSLLKFISDVTQCFQLDRFVPFHHESDLETAAKQHAKSHELIAGIVFLNLDGKSDHIPRKIEYKIRSDIDDVPTTKLLKERMWEPGPRAAFKDLGYQRGFVQIQEMLDRAITLIHINTTDLIVSPEVHLQQFPYPCYSDDKFAFYMRALTPVVATMAWIFLIAFLIREIVLEREKHLEEMLRVLGLRPSVAWITWFLIGFAVMASGSLIGLLILKMAQMFPHSNFGLLFLYLLAFACSILMYCYMISSFFSKATIAALSGIVAYLSSYLPFMVAITLEYEMTFLHKISTCLSMSTSFCFGMMYLSRFESQGSGIQWSNIWHSPMADDPMNFGWALVMMLIDGLIYFVIGWYVSNVSPASGKVQASPFYFFLTPRYWGFPGRSSNKVPVIEHLSNNMNANSNKISKKMSLENPYLESSWSQKRPGMSIQDLHVVYNRGTSCEHMAVSNLNLELKEGQVSTILGRNGAGKTTTINVLTGQLAPTSGSVMIYGHEIPREFSRARKLLGYCPQYNTLFGELTVREHLSFYCQLKGLIPDDKCNDEVDSILNSTDLWQVQNEQAKCLSGGLQRRLCVALAFVGGSKLIILDEPTSSVDPVARRGIWDLIAHQKRSRTVLLTTHHLDEADILSDQVAIIHRGRLLCSGSPLLLRSQHGCGYQLTVSRQGTSQVEAGDSDSGRASNEYMDETDSSSPPSEKLLSFVKCLIPNASLMEDFGYEVALALPYQSPSGENHDYGTFFRCLDSNLKSLGFASYGLSSTTLEDVFISLCNQEEERQAKNEPKQPVVDHHRSISSKSVNAEAAVSELRKQFDQAFNSFDWSAPSLETGITLKMKQLKGLLMKRYLHSRNDMRSVFCNLVLPCFFIALAMGMTLIKPKFAPDPILPLSPRIYGKGATTFFSALNHQSSLNGIANELTLTPERDHTCASPRSGWIVAKCPVVMGANRSEDVLLPKYLRTFTGHEWSDVGSNCDCGKECQTPAGRTSYSSAIRQPVKAGVGYIYNITDVSISNFLLDTFTMFNDKRYGGFSFHRRNNSIGITFDVAKVWFDNNGFHSMPSYLNAFDDALLKANVRHVNLDPDEYSIVAYSHPLHVRSNQVGDQSFMQRGGDAGIALIILVGFIFIPTSFIFYIVSERMNEEKQLLRIFGVGQLLYWVSSLFWDVMSLLLAVLISGCVIAAFQMPIYTARQNLPAVLLLIFLFGWAMISLVYLVNRFFTEPSIAFMVMYSLALFVGINTMVVRLLIDVFELVHVSPMFKNLFEQVCQFLPPYSLMSGLTDVTRNQLFTEIYTLFDHDVYVSPFSMDLLGKHYIILTVEGFVFFILHLIIEFVSTWRISWTRSVTNSVIPHEDSDVADERTRVTQESSRFDIMRVINVSKIVKSMAGTKAAVDRISFAVTRGECFGLLGVNGAGKTTLFRMLTGQIKPTTGKTVINRMSIFDLLSGNSQFLGYCPQADALDDVLSPRQHLTVYSELRGVPTMHISRVCP